jgi:hypothetical protein
MIPKCPLELAIQLAERGFAVFPCLLSKKPACEHGFKSATTDVIAVSALWQRHPGELVGVATGATSDLAVLDIDAKHVEARGWWRLHRGTLPPTWTVRTRSGGLHLWFRHMPGLRCSVSVIARGIDVRAEGGYVIAWHVAGSPILRQGPLAPWPDWLKPPTRQKTGRLTEPPRVPDERQTAALVRFVALAPESERNNRLFWAACRMGSMVASGSIVAAEAEALLVHAAVHAGLPEIEARRTTRSGFETGGIVS